MNEARQYHLVKSPLRTIQKILVELKNRFPDLSVDQQSGAWPYDDDGLWWVYRKERTDRTLVQSDSGNAPFLLESTSGTDRRTVVSVDEVLHLIADAIR